MAGLILSLFLIFQAKEPLLLLTAILIHEASHIITALFFTREMPSLELNGAGFKLSYIGLSSCAEQITVSASGPFANILFALIFHRMKFFSLYSLSLAMINLLPASCLDGGGILRALTERYLMPQTSYIICKAASVTTVLLIFALNCYIQLKLPTNISLAIVSVFITIQVLSKQFN